MSSTDPSEEVVGRLRELFHRNGYVRRQNAARIRDEGHGAYKKGYEVRLVAGSEVEAEQIRVLLLRAGFTPGRPFAKSKQFRVPIYGREAVARFLDLMGEAPG